MTLSASNPVLRRLSSSTLSSSSPSLTSLVSPWHCPHRVHRHFVRLKALKMNNNRLTRFIVRVEMSTGAEVNNMCFGSPVDGSQSPVATSPYDYPRSRIPAAVHIKITLTLIIVILLVQIIRVIWDLWWCMYLGTLTIAPFKWICFTKGLMSLSADIIACF